MNKKIEKLKSIVPDGVNKLARLFVESGYEINLVGGCVRDFFMDVTPHDWDMNTNASPDDMIRLCKNNKLHYMDIGLKHGTITIVVDGEFYEVTTYRIDGDYSDGRHPDGVSFTDDLLKDLSRRDFNMNAIAVSLPDYTVFDPYNGLYDIQKKVLRAVGNPDLRIREDALRMLRAIRFAVTYEMEISKPLRDAIAINRTLLSNVSKERITEEFRKMFSKNKNITGVFLDNKYFIAQIIPEIRKCVDFQQNNRYHKHDVFEHMLNVVDNCKIVNENDAFVIKMAALLHDIGKPDAYVVDEEGYGHFYHHPEDSYEISARVLSNDFCVSNEERDVILDLVRYHDMTPALTKKSMRRILSRHGEEFMRKWFILKQADMDDHIYPDGDKKYLSSVKPYEELMEELLNEEPVMSVKMLDINGLDVMKELEIRPGKEVGYILNSLLECVLDECVANTKDDLISKAKELHIQYQNYNGGV